MEEKLRNLSQNIANNTGDEHKPKKHNLEEETPWDKHEEEHREEEHEEHHEEEHEEHHEEHDDSLEGAEETDDIEKLVEDTEKLRYKLDIQNKQEDLAEPEEEISDYTPDDEAEPEEEEEIVPEAEEKQSEENEEAPEEAHEDESEENIEEESEETHEEESENQDLEAPEEPEAEEHHSEAKILSMNVDEEPEQSSNRTKKYSPEVEEALKRLNSEEAEVDTDTEPLSTEPKKKHHGGQIFLTFLFFIAIAAVVLCVLVEQKVVENPLNMFNKKTEESSKVVPTTEEPVKEDTAEAALTDTEIINQIDATFTSTQSHFIYKRTHQKKSGNEYVYYYVAEPDSTNEKDCKDDGTDCEPNAAETITADNYKNYPHYRYTYIKAVSGSFEFSQKELVSATNSKE